jgi:hypothetical protein
VAVLFEDLGQTQRLGGRVIDNQYAGHAATPAIIFVFPVGMPILSGRTEEMNNLHCLRNPADFTSNHQFIISEVRRARGWFLLPAEVCRRVIGYRTILFDSRELAS